MVRRVVGLMGSVLLVGAALGLGGAGVALGKTDAISPQTAQRPAVATLSIQRLGNGSVVSTPAGINCGPGANQTACSANFAEGTNITLRATPVFGWAWNYWDGACVGRTTPTCTFRITASSSVLVIFVGVDGYTAKISPTWENSLLNGTIDIAGIASHDAKLRFAFLSFKEELFGATQLDVPSPGGNFSAKIVLRRRRALPGKFVVRMTGTVSNRQIPARDVLIVLRAPREGLVGKAWVTALGSKTPIIKLPRGSVGAEAHFQFAFQPARGTRITATWFQGRIKLGSAAKPRGKTVISKVFKPGGLPRGFFYKCELRVNGVLVKEVGVKTGR